MSEIISLGSGDTLGNSGISGKVGIGTTAPTTKLQIQGTKDSQTNIIKFEVNDTYPRIQFSGNSVVINFPNDKNFYFGETTNTGNMVFRGVNVGIGQTNPTEKLEVSGNVKIGVGDYDGGLLKFGSYSLWVDCNGKLRIKNGTPIYSTDGDTVGSQS